MRVAQLDVDDVYLGMVELAEGVQPTAQQIATINDCDLTPGRYKWIRHARNAFGGEFVPLESTAVRPAPDMPTVEEVVALLILKPSDPRLAKWANWFRRSMDASGRAI